MMEKEYYQYDNISTIYKEMCTHIPPAMNSKGVWNNHFSKFSLPLLEFQIIVIICFNLFFHFIFKFLGFSNLITNISAGLSICGILKKLQEKSEEFVFTLQSQQTLSTLSSFGYMLFLFITGVKMDIKMILTTGKKSMAVGFIALAAPLLANMAYISMFGRKFFKSGDAGKDEQKVKELFNLAVTQSLTTFPVISYLLNELHIINSELGRLALSSAVLSELLSVVCMTIVVTITTMRSANPVQPGTGNVYLNITLLVLFLICAVYVVRPAMFWVIKQTPEGRPVKDSYIMVIVLGVLLFAMLSHTFGQLVLFAPYILGLVIPDGPPLGSALVNKLDTFVSGLLLPLFITCCAARVNFSGFAIKFDAEVWGVIGSAIVTFGVKIISCLMVTKWGCKMPLNDSLALSFIMSSKGVVEMATYSFIRDSEEISAKSFSTGVMTTMVQAAIIPFIIRRLYDPTRKYAGYQKRDIAHLRTKDEFRVLVCIHRPDNISSTIKLLDASSPTRQNPIAVFVLHLIELTGRTTPIFISHQFQTKTISDHSYSENVILAFDQYEENKENYAVSVQTYTAISPPKLMHEDICTLSLNKLTSLIIMPFHRKWAMDGSLESENSNIRILNSSVLDRAPCSVGILIDRARLVRSTSLGPSSSLKLTYRVAMIFISGNDDHEALAYATRLAQGTVISSLTVIRFVTKDCEEIKEWEWMIDAEVLKEFKMNNEKDDERIRYREEKVCDGPEMALRIREMVDDFELIIVGRRYMVESPQTSGLEEWCEFPELGVIGDLLASPDLDSRTSVLVVQQQHMAVKAKS